MSDQDMLYEVRDNIATITFNRPERMNACTGAMFDALHSAAIALRNVDPRAVVDDAQAPAGMGAGAAAPATTGVGFEQQGHVMQYDRHAPLC